MIQYEHDAFHITDSGHNAVAVAMNEHYGPHGWEAYAIFPSLEGTTVHMRRQKPIEVTDEMVAGFKALWEQADREGKEGNRVRTALEALFRIYQGSR